MSVRNIQHVNDDDGRGLYYIYSMATITKKEGIIVKNRSDMFAVFVGITKNVLQVRGSTCTKQRK